MYQSGLVQNDDASRLLSYAYKGIASHTAISLQKRGSVGAKNGIVTKWPLCKGLKLSLCVEEISTGMEKPLVRRAHDLLRVAAYGQLDGATVKINVKQGLELESFPSSGGFGHGDFKRTLDWQNRLLFHGSMLLGFTI